MPRTKTLRPDFSDLAESWGRPYVARKQVGEFSGGMLNPRTLANLDSFGQGPEGRVRMGRTVAYPVKSLVKWMEDRTEQL